MRIAWATDIHLDHVNDNGLIRFGEMLNQANAEAVLLTGDISNAKQVSYHLSALERVVQKPVYFVLGNHDYYGGSIADVRSNMHALSNMSQYLRYLPTSPYTVLSPNTALIGHDGWYDALNGDAKKSRFRMADWAYIAEFALSSNHGRSIPDVITVAQKLAHEGVMHIHNSIKSATRYHNNIVIATHVPPYPESHMHEGKVGDNEAQPWFTSKILGDMLRQAATAYPKVQFTVFAGHTHGKYSGKFADNLTVHVGGWPVGVKDYGNPILQDVVVL